MPIHKLHVEMDLFVTGENRNLTPGEIFELIQRMLEEYGCFLVDSGKAVPIGPKIQRTKAG